MIDNYQRKSKFVKKNRREVDIEEIFQGILAGNRAMLAKGITLIESNAAIILIAHRIYCKRYCLIQINLSVSVFQVFREPEKVRSLKSLVRIYAKPVIKWQYWPSIRALLLQVAVFWAIKREWKSCP